MKVILGNGRWQSGSKAKCNVKSLWGLLFSVLFFSTVGAWAQTAVQPVWQGVLRNPAGAPIPAAKVRLASATATTEAVSRADGQFRLPALPAGQ